MKSIFNLTHKAVVVTGGGSGIGKAICETFAKAGATVYILDLNAKDADTVAREIKEKGQSAISYACNVTSRTEVKSTLQSILGRSRVNILINNAGIAHVGNIENTTEEDLDRLYAVNIKGLYYCVHGILPHFKENGGGTILNVASIASSAGIADRFAYSMTKGAVLSMTYSVAKDYLPFNIRCNSISPARVHTPFVDGFIAKNYPGREKEMFDKLSASQPIGRMATPEEVAYLALYLCSDEAAFVTGSDYPIDGGYLKLK